MVITSSLAFAASAAEPARAAPRVTAPASAVSTTSYAATLWPFFTRFDSIGWPMVPVPMNPIFHERTPLGKLTGELSSRGGPSPSSPLRVPRPRPDRARRGRVGDDGIGHDRARREGGGEPPPGRRGAALDRRPAVARRHAPDRGPEPPAPLSGHPRSEPASRISLQHPRAMRPDGRVHGGLPGGVLHRRHAERDRRHGARRDLLGAAHNRGAGAVGTQIGRAHV